MLLPILFILSGRSFLISVLIPHCLHSLLTSHTSFWDTTQVNSPDPPNLIQLTLLWALFESFVPLYVIPYHAYSNNWFTSLLLPL